jgi:hypothetical protein
VSIKKIGKILTIFWIVFLIAASSPDATPSSTLYPTEHVALRQGRGENVVLLLVHGFSSHGGFQCDGYWKDFESYLGQEHWQPSIRTPKFYSGDTGCARHNPDGSLESDSEYDLHNSKYTQRCAGVFPEGTNVSQDGTNNESLSRLTCLFAWYVYLDFPGQHVEIVAHSAGGLIVRAAIESVEAHAKWMPPTLPIGGVVDVAVPHAGLLLARFACFPHICTQGADIEPGSTFMVNLSAKSQQFTISVRWTIIDSQCDGYDDPAFAYTGGSPSAEMAIPGTGQYIIYADKPGGACYQHDWFLSYQGKQIHEDILDAIQYVCNASKEEGQCNNFSFENYREVRGPRSLRWIYDALLNGAS